MALILEYDDYMEVREGLELITEGTWIGSLFKKMKEKFFTGKFEKFVNEIVGPDVLDTMIDPKTGTFNPTVISEDDIANPDNNLNDVFTKVQNEVKEGKYFLTVLKFLKEALEVDDQIHKIKMTKDQLAEEGGSEEEESVKNQELESLEKRGEQLMAQLEKTKVQAEQNVLADIKAMVNEKAKDKLFVKNAKFKPIAEQMMQNRLRNAKTVLLMLEYEVKKKRFKREDIEKLRDDLVEEYKGAVKSNQKLKQMMDQAKDELGKTPESKTNTETDAKEIVKKKYAPGDQVKFKDKAVTIVSFEDGGVKVKMEKGAPFALKYSTLKNDGVKVEAGTTVKKKTVEPA